MFWVVSDTSGIISDKKYFKKRAMMENQRKELYWFSEPNVFPVKDMIPTFEKTQSKAITVNMLVKMPLFLATAGMGLLVKLIIFCLSINISKILLINATMTKIGIANENRAINPN